MSLDPSLVRHGRVNGRYFRENFAQGGIDLVQIVPELVTNADSAIALGGRPSGRIVLRFGRARPGLRQRVEAGDAPVARAGAAGLAARAALQRRRRSGWTPRRSTGGSGRSASTPDASGQRGLFGRGLRDVWLAQGGGRIEGLHDGPAGRVVVLPVRWRRPVRLRPRPRRDGERGGARASSGSTARGRGSPCRSRPDACRPMRACGGWSASSCSCGRCSRTRCASCGSSCPASRRSSSRCRRPSPTPSARCCSTTRSRSRRGVRARVIVRRAAEPIPLSPSRATRLGGLVIRSGRPRTRPRSPATRASRARGTSTARSICEEIEQLQRAALDSPRPQVVVKVDRSGLNEHHPFVQRLYAASSACCARSSPPRSAAPAPISCAPAGRCRRATRSACARSTTRCATRSTRPARAGFERGGAPVVGAGARRRPRPPSRTRPASAARLPDAALVGAMRFKQSPVRLHPGEDRGVSLVIDPAQVPPGSPVAVTADAGLRLKFWAGRRARAQPRRLVAPDRLACARASRSIRERGCS